MNYYQINRIVTLDRHEMVGGSGFSSICKACAIAAAKEGANIT
jgi:hypothetical protein